ncbi:MAG: D,D-heptose 1,7-bisphosphate phosphatase [Candidatus Kaiserbacteria bacterium GW2011_GWA2_49_19]|uniref:D,D-heptose 1,7-bisphosphate phosphatase n=1 Tax=Candidatus Kaiserbacteria bacterium GW2011_GWA2_49_19 TaxID=1618669 RepID=A0A0G1VS61_9BACT|nr:MAG: D,D-heptose 1,7-bisphosphate phosphatase [Candidatus Kaiserbacteria bacterium GW2011_GWA2_49_19]
MSQRAVMIDRDGVINNDGDHVWKIDQLKILPRVSEAIQMLNDHGWIVIVITNQPVVARGWATEADVEALHAEIGRRIAPARIDRWYYCPHHPEATLPEYRLDCPDRKPKTGFILRAQKDFSLALPECYVIGDLPADIKMGTDSGCRTILVKTGFAGVEKNPKRDYRVQPDAVADNLLAAVKLIIKAGK